MVQRWDIYCQTTRRGTEISQIQPMNTHVPFLSQQSIPSHSDDIPGTIPGTTIPLDKEEVHDFLSAELSCEKLSSIHGYLWMCGRRFNTHPLHWQIMMSRNIYITEDPSLHLVWFQSIIYIKPLPRCLLSWSFWDKHIRSDGHDGANQETIWKEANGFMLTYTRLIHHESDFQIARTHGLLPPGVTWRQWSLLRRDVVFALRAADLSNITPRYQFGELRLSRLNLVYRVFLLRLLGYHHVHRDYNAFFSSQFAWILLLFAYLSIALTAFQTSLSVDNVPDAFQRVGYRFGVTVLFLVGIGVLAQVVLLIILFLYNLFRTLTQSTTRSPR